MLAKASLKVPQGDGWIYEPKWDGFRCIVFRDGDEVELGSRNGKPLTRYFPELVAAILEELPERCVIDGEIVIADRDRLNFETLQQRIHPAASRVDRLAAETPASFVAFDLLALGDDDLTGEPFEHRRTALADALSDVRPPIYLSQVTSDPEVAQDWFEQFEGAGLDGILAKPADSAYRPGERILTKVKHQRTADCVVAGFRWHKSGPVVGSLLLGLFNDDGELQHIGVTSSFTMARRAELVTELEPLRENALENHPWAAWQRPQSDNPDRMPGAVSRWNSGKDLSWQPLRCERVVEIRYDQLEGSRLRHTGFFLRWRPDRDPESCRYDQLDTPVKFDLAEVLGEGAS